MQRGPCGIWASGRQGRGCLRETGITGHLNMSANTSCLVRGNLSQGSCHIAVSCLSPQLGHLPYPDLTSASFQAMGWSLKTALSPQRLPWPHPVFSTTSAPGSVGAGCLDAKFPGPPPKQDGGPLGCLCRAYRAPSSCSKGAPASPSAPGAHMCQVVPLSPRASSVPGSGPHPGGLGVFPNWPDGKHPENCRRPGCLRVSGLVSPLARTQRPDARQPPGASAV